MRRRQLLAGAWAGIGLAAMQQQAAAQALVYPAHPVRLVVPFAPGGGTDNLGRIVALEFQRALQQPFVVENRAGANGRIGTDLIAKSPADGYALLIGGIGALTIAPHLETMPYNAEKDFTPITLLGTADSILLVNPALPVNDFPQLLDYLRSQGGRASFGSSGVAGPYHMAGELLKSLAQVEMTHVPYKGDGAALVDLMAGTIQLMFTSVSAGLPHIKAGKVRMVAGAGERRTPLFPEIKTIAEQGLPGFSADSWVGLFGPAGLPAPVVEVLQTSVVRMMADEGIKQKLLAQGITPVGSTPQYLDEYVKREYLKWGRVIRERGLKGAS